MKEHNKCIDGRCPAGIDSIRKISLTPREKGAIFHSILNLAPIAQSMEKKKEAPEVLST